MTEQEASPLSNDLLGLAGVRVISVESSRRRGSLGEIIAYMKLLYKRRDLIVTIAWCELKTTVIRSPLSYLWWLMDPLLSLVCYLFLVLVLSRGRGLDVPYPLFILTALMPWTLMTRCVTAGAKIWHEYEATITQIRFPYLALIFARYLHEIVLYLISYVILFSACICYGYFPSITWLALPAVVVVHSVLIIGMMLLASVLSWFFADLSRVLPYLLRIWWFSSPALYSIKMLPPWAQKLMPWNPMVLMFESYRACILHGRFPDWVSLGYYLLITGMVLLVAMALFIRREPYITRYI